MRVQSSLSFIIFAKSHCNKGDCKGNKGKQTRKTSIRLFTESANFSKKPEMIL